MEAVGPVALGLVAVLAAPCISRILERKGDGIHPPIIIIQLTSNTLERFASNVTYVNNGTTTMLLSIMLGYRARIPQGQV